MLKLITDNFNFISYAFEFLAMLTSILCFNKYKNTSTKIFVYFLIYIVFVDFTGATYYYHIDFAPTTYLRSIGFNSKIWYNIFWLFGSVLFVLYYIYIVLQRKCNKNYISVLAMLFILLMLGHFFMYPQVFLKQHCSYYQLLGAFSLLVGCSIYFIEFINSESIRYAFKTFSFYALSAVLIWWIIITPVLLFEAYNTEADWDFANLKRRIFVFANIFMYSCFAIGLIVSKPHFKND